MSVVQDRRQRFRTSEIGSQTTKNNHENTKSKKHEIFRLNFRGFVLS